MVIVMLIIKCNNEVIFIPPSCTQLPKLIYLCKLLLPCLQMILDLLTSAHCVEALIDSPSTCIEMDLLEAL